MLRRRPTPDEKLVGALRNGDPAAFAELVDRHHGSLVRLAQTYVRDRAVAEEVAQETWLLVLQGLAGFQHRSALKTWIFRILVNRAKTRGARERRQVPVSALAENDGPSVDPARFQSADDPRYPLHWARPPEPWPEQRLLMRETIELVRDALRALPPAQQVVLGLRDVEGWAADEVCAALEISPGNERVLLHRARSALRRRLESHLQPT